MDTYIYIYICTVHKQMSKVNRQETESYHDLTNLVLLDGDLVIVHKHIYISDVGNCSVASVVIPLSDQKWN